MKWVVNDRGEVIESWTIGDDDRYDGRCRVRFEKGRSGQSRVVWRVAYTRPTEVIAEDWVPFMVEQEGEFPCHVSRAGRCVRLARSVAEAAYEAVGRAIDAAVTHPDRHALPIDHP